MKKLGIVLAFMLCALTTAWAQIVTENEPAVVYYSPKNYVVVDFTYSVTTYEVGIYAQYAEELLGIRDVVLENKTVYALDKVQFNTRTVADLDRPHKIIFEADAPTQLITLNDKGILKGYNLSAIAQSKPENSQNRLTRHNRETIESRQSRDNVMPFTEEVLEAKSIQAQAQAVAKQLFRLRETRLYLLSGEVEHAPADGVAMKSVLEELDKQEAALVALFTGKINTKQRHERKEYLPACGEKATEIHHLYFSEENGFTSSDNIDADSIAIILRSEPQKALQQVVTEQPKGKKSSAPTPSQIVYNLPGQCLAIVRFKAQTLGEKTLPIAQLGVDVPLAKELFTGKELPIIRFNEKTGNIESISK